MPVYRLTAGLTADRLRAAMRVALDRAGHDYPEYLPDADPAAEDVPPIGEALEHAHYPTSFEARDAALRRLAFDELLALQLGMVSAGAASAAGRTPSRSPVDDDADEADPAALAASLGRKLGQRRRPHGRSGDGDRRDPRPTSPGPTPMLRLLQGDVGSGKTAVAAWALAAAGPGRAPGRAARPDGPARPPARDDPGDAPRGPRPRRSRC